MLRAFDGSYDTAREDLAFRVRGDFLRAFPRNELGKLGVDDYVIGHKGPTFCDYVEAKTRAWANIVGATAFKFGIYYGKTKSDPHVTYRFTSRYGDTKANAFKAVKNALLALVSLGGRRNLDFAAIDANPLSQLFKAKILSLYYPKRFLNVCSAEHLEMLGIELGYAEDRPVSEYQHLLVQAKLTHPVTQSWSNPKFMAFLYKTYVRPERESTSTVQKPPRKRYRRVNFEDLQGERDAVGKAAEEYALTWEKERLSGADLDRLIPNIEDLRDRPGYGYDFLSHTSSKRRRYIEVKSVGKLPSGEGHRFFLSDNQYAVSRSAAHRAGYFFYLVFFDGKGQPVYLCSVAASDLYGLVEIVPASYVVRFKFARSTMPD